MKKAAILDPIRSKIPATARERWYVIAGVISTLLVGLKVLDQATAAAWLSLVIATITLAFALLYATSTWRVGLYGLLIAVQGVAQLYGIFNGSLWAAIIGLAATLLGTATAAAKTPTTVDGEVVSVRDTEY
ncbi:phage holin [Rhodococcoides fascians]|uniref:phage holin n=1 Tax=Rhodococcoides fascians TaxID=1828 RepID=UPI0037A49D0D